MEYLSTTFSVGMMCTSDRSSGLFDVVLGVYKDGGIKCEV